ncbi:flagellar protein MotY [Metapseudomonas furukawaii]|uniref:Sodium-type flagellar protein motY n=1 Tax=Metapseudomonas furukawaii TaxID=1149133 RepID=A0AAD1FEH3_METFU|nr:MULTISPECIES: OmpA family protein [Pseudomonas]ELS27215.1 Sodium-type flagellar protein motY precursor [Pseudomonas furukawaii]WAG80347.1 OmpA family protein [Pseudomonas furukawaii]BAU72987.1 sodium-type flagellar protein motY precursor [Pseudomonas furukawaii]
MRQRYLVFLSLFASLPAMAITFQTRLEKVEWKVEGDKFECRLSQPITDFGAGEFVRRAGEQATFRLKARERWMGAGSATLLAAAAPWQPGRGDINLGVVSVEGGEVPFNSSQQQAGRLLTGLLEGRSPVIRHRTLQGGDALEVRLLPARFEQAYQAYLDCTAKLLPVNFDQVKRMQLGFPGGGMELDDMARARLEIMLDFIKADPSVNHIEIDGHSDNSGNRLTNRDLSRRRALAVFEYLKANGFPEAQMVMRFHGERYPLVPNNSSANRAKNRRVTVQLSRVDLPQSSPSTPADAPATPAAPASEAPAVPPAPPAKAPAPTGS